jgi:methionine-rich copper-binding protein CopC
MMSRKIKLAAIVCAAVGLTATIAQAHPKMEMSAPAAGATVTSVPREIKMGFSEALIGNFTGLELTDAKGKNIKTGPASLDPHDKTRFAVPVQQRLMPGNYKVSWHAVSVDTHRVTGNYSFKVAR